MSRMSRDEYEDMMQMMRDASRNYDSFVRTVKMNRSDHIPLEIIGSRSRKAQILTIASDYLPTIPMNTVSEQFLTSFQVTYPLIAGGTASYSVAQLNEIDDMKTLKSIASELGVGFKVRKDDLRRDIIKKIKTDISGMETSYLPITRTDDYRKTTITVERPVRMTSTKISAGVPVIVSETESTRVESVPVRPRSPVVEQIMVEEPVVTPIVEPAITENVIEQALETLTDDVASFMDSLRSSAEINIDRLEQDRERIMAEREEDKGSVEKDIEEFKQWLKDEERELTYDVIFDYDNENAMNYVFETLRGTPVPRDFAIKISMVPALEDLKKIIDDINTDDVGEMALEALKQERQSSDKLIELLTLLLVKTDDTSVFISALNKAIEKGFDEIVLLFETYGIVLEPEQKSESLVLADMGIETVEDLKASRINVTYDMLMEPSNDNEEIYEYMIETLSGRPVPRDVALRLGAGLYTELFDQLKADINPDDIGDIALEAVKNAETRRQDDLLTFLAILITSVDVDPSVFVHALQKAIDKGFDDVVEYLNSNGVS